MELKHSVPIYSISNARELGGYITADGKQVKNGVLIRTANLSHASHEDIEKLVNSYRLQHIIDFRMKMEMTGAEDPLIDGVTYHCLGVIDPSIFGDESIINDIDMSKFDIMKIIELALQSGMLDEKMYIGFLESEKGKQAYSTFFRILLSAKPDHAVLWHCTSGKDRTGLAAMLLLSALGIDEEIIISDYLLTNDYYALRIAATKQLLQERGCNKDFIAQAVLVFDAVDERYMRHAIAYLKHKYGSVMGYIIDGLNLSQREIDSLKEKYLK